MAKKKYDFEDLYDFIQVEVYIECSNSKCSNGDISMDETGEDFFEKGWRATRTNVYCPECAKKKLKL